MKLRLTLAAAAAVLLGSFGLHPLFAGLSWGFAGMGAIVAVTAAGLLGRRLRLSAPLSLGLSLLALLEYLTVGYAAGHALLWVIPTPSALIHLGSLLHAGWATANHYAPPVPVKHGISLMASLGIGLVAVCVDFLAVRLRRAAPAGLPLLAMYSVPAAIREEGIGWLPFVLGAAGFMTLLLVDAQEQVTGWGRHVHAARWHDEGEPGRPVRPVASADRGDARALAETGRRVGFAALALAVLVPLVVPGIHPKGLFGLGGPGDGTGGGTGVVHTPNALVTMRRQLLQDNDSTVLTYTTDDSATPEYLQMTVLDQFNGENWTESLTAAQMRQVEDHDLPAPPGLDGTVGTRQVRTKVSIGKHTEGVTFLPLPYAPRSVQVKGDWRVDPASLMVYSFSSNADGKDYSVLSERATPVGTDLEAALRPPAAIARVDEAIPPNVPPRVGELARQIIDKAKAVSPYQEAMALQAYFTSGRFTYSLSAPEPTKLSDLEDFLFDSRTGYCEQFASSMALLARELGIPARVAVGYTQGTREGDKWVVRSGDAHAWPELYFEGVGWVRFEPTPVGGAGTTGQGSATVPDYALPPNASTPGGTPDPATVPSGGAQPSASASSLRGHHQDDQNGNGESAFKGQGGSSFQFWWVAVPAVLLILLATPLLVRSMTRARRWARPTGGGTADVPAGPPGGGPDEVAHAAWAELRADAIDHGLPWLGSDTPRATVRRLSDHLDLSDGAVAALRRISNAEERARYATEPAPSQGLRADVRTMREAFATGVGRGARLRARLAPPTALTSIRTTTTTTLETLDQGTDRVLARLRRLGRRRR